MAILATNNVRTSCKGVSVPPAEGVRTSDLPRTPFCRHLDERFGLRSPIEVETFGFSPAGTSKSTGYVCMVVRRFPAARTGPRRFRFPGMVDKGYALVACATRFISTNFDFDFFILRFSEDQILDSPWGPVCST